MILWDFLDTCQYNQGLSEGASVMVEAGEYGGWCVYGGMDF